MISFGRKGKLSTRYVGRYEIHQRVGEVAYELTFPLELASVHKVFHVSMIEECQRYLASILLVEDLGIDENLSSEEVPVKILDRLVKRLRNNEIATENELWRIIWFRCYMGGLGQYEIPLPPSF